MATCPGGFRARLVRVAVCAAAVSTLLAASATSSVAEPRRSLSDVKDQIAALQHKAEVATERYNTARAERDGVTLRLRTLRDRVDAKRSVVAGLEKDLGGMAAASYRNGGFGKEMQLFFSDDPREFIEAATALQEVTRRQASVVRDVTHAQHALAADQRLLVSQEAQLAEIDHRLGARKAEVEKHLGKARHVLASLEAKQRARLEAQRKAALARASRAARTAAPSSVGAASGAAATAVAFARAQLGEPYVWGGAGPDSWDCSGLTMMAWRAAGVSLPHSSSMQYNAGRRVSQSELQPGDLVFYYSPISHVAIYVGNGQIIHAPNSSEPVMVASLDLMPYAGAVRP